MTNIGSTRKKKHTCKILSEEEKFTWEIPNFREMIATNPEVKDVHYLFESGDGIGLPTSWKVYLVKQKDNQLGIFMVLLKAPQEVPKVKATWGYKTLKFDRKDVGPHEFTKNSKGWGWGNDILSLNLDSFTDDDLESGSLVINITFTVFKDIILNGEYKRRQFERESRDTAAADFEKLLESGEDADVTFELTDGQTLKAHAVFLKARSRVFSAMLQNQMQESSSGIIRVIDVSYKTMKTILKFIYAGKLDDKWEEMIEEIVYAANKYELLALLKFCDENLATTCKPENAWNLMDFAKLHGLKTAQVEIAEYFKVHLNEILQAKICS